MRSILFVTAFLALTPVANADNFYVGTYGGANWDDVIEVNGVEDSTGYVVGGVVGTKVKAVNGLRIEADVSFRQNDVTVFKFLDVSHETFAVMANAVYDLPVALGPVTPYVLGGIGYGHTEAVIENVSLLKLEASGLAWQLGVGLNAQVADGVVFGVGYRYLQTEELEVLGTQLSDGSNHAVLAEVKFAL